eukprot:COSAG04_NODE_628_length_11766_cov_17.672152_7_plen_405_part_00
MAPGRAIVHGEAGPEGGPRRRPRPGCGVAALPMKEVIVTPSDIEEMALYLGAPLEFMPGLAQVCMVAFWQQLPKNWSEVRAHSHHTPPPPHLAIGANEMLYLHATSGRLHDTHPHDAFFRMLVKCVLRSSTPDDGPFSQPILRFHVTDDRSGLRKTYYYNFEQHEVVGEPLEEERALLAEHEETERQIAAYTLTVEKFAVGVIEAAWRELRVRLQFRKAQRLQAILQNIHARTIQRSWRRRRKRRLLRDWDNTRTLRIMWKVWWKRLVNSPNFAFRLRVVRARRRVAEAEGGDHSVRLGKIELSGQERAHIDTLTARMAVLEGRLTARYLWELEKQETIDAARALRAQKREAARLTGVELRNETPIPAGPLDGTADQLCLEDRAAVEEAAAKAVARNISTPADS